ncbi:hypothetical protein F5Y10DRAFT_290237 [Nemania abortiva]|nr:hypothetical protein F5Y10DRAFT_290237 [Nemania abortiva]
MPWHISPPGDCRPCADCEMGFYSDDCQCNQPNVYFYSFTPRDSEANAIISRHLATIRQAAEILANKFDTHADLFMSRWKKCSKAKRERILRTVAPHIAPDPWHCFDHGYIPPGTTWADYLSSKVRHQLLLPWLDLETLTNHPNMLFALLHYRIHYPPQSWAAFDTRELELGWGKGKFKVGFSRKCVVVHGHQYGKLVDWDRLESHRADTLGFPRAELLFEAQAYLMTTLKDLVLQVLDGVNEATPARTSKWRELTHACKFRRTNEIELWSPYTFPAFSPPPALKFDYLRSLASARFAASKDHLWQLQCNPGYVRRSFKLYLGLNTASDERKAVCFVSRIVSEIHMCLMWKCVEHECKKAEDLQRQFRDNIHPGQPLPFKYNRAVWRLERILGEMAMYAMDCFAQDITETEAISRVLTFVKFKELQPLWLPFKRGEKWDSHDPLLWCLTRMTSPTGRLEFDGALLFSYLQHHLSVSNVQEKARINGFIYQWVSDLSAFYEAVMLVRLGRPHARFIEPWDKEGIDFGTELLFLSNKNRTLSPNPLAKIFLKEFFRAEPPRGPKDLEWLRCSRATRAGLEHFWALFYDSLTSEVIDVGGSEAEAQRMLQIVAATRSTEYQEAVLAEETEILTGIERQKEARETASELAKSYGGDEGNATTPNKETESQNESLESDPAPAPAPAPVPVQTTKRAMKAIKLMFPTTAEEASNGLQWEDFIHAMNDMGFVARNGGGSAVSFEAEGQGRIVFHRPHPESKIAPVVLRTMGARMSKSFAWSRESFYL